MGVRWQVWGTQVVSCTFTHHAYARGRVGHKHGERHECVGCWGVYGSQRGGSVQVPRTQNTEAPAGARGRPQPEPLPVGEAFPSAPSVPGAGPVLAAEGRAEPLLLWGLTSRGDSLRQRHGGCSASVLLLGRRTVGQARARGRWAVLGWSAKAPLAEGRREWCSRWSSRCKGPGRKWLWVYGGGGVQTAEAKAL